MKINKTSNTVTNLVNATIFGRRFLAMHILQAKSCCNR